MPPTLAYGPPVISVDVEDWPQSTWNRQLPITDRAAVNTQRLLGVLRQAGVRVTMFVLGKFAERFPAVVREIQADGHEVASHGYGHVEIAALSPREFLTDVRCGKDVLEQILGKTVKGYRAPDFSIVRDTLWAFDVLGEVGFEYDSSVVPVRLVRYGIPDWPILPVRVKLGGGATILEAPIATIRWFGRNWPVGGGGYHRLLPGWLARHLAHRAMAEAPFVYYCHPYEFDVRELHEIALPLPLRVRVHQGVGRRWFEQRFKAFLTRFGGRRMQDLLSSQCWTEVNLRNFASPSSAS
jgi:polysaccharide deacetylase family protein (PEP-CTERM system associated)